MSVTGSWKEAIAFCRVFVGPGAAGAGAGAGAPPVHAESRSRKLAMLTLLCQERRTVGLSGRFVQLRLGSRGFGSGLVFPSTTVDFRRLIVFSANVAGTKNEMPGLRRR